MKKIVLIVSVFSIFCNATAQVQQKQKEKKPLVYKPIKFNISEDGSQYFRVITWLQTWATLTQNNPGTVGYDFKPLESSSAIAIRRARVLFLSQLSPRFLILTHFGINNQSYNSGGATGSNDGKKPQMFIHDVWTEYAVVPRKLYLGTGLLHWNGVSRMATGSTMNFMTLDAPIFNWITIETNDQFARQLGIYAKGQLNRLDYRLSLTQPFRFGVNPFTETTKTTNGFNNMVAAKNGFTSSFAPQAYFQYMFKDIESNLLPFQVGSHLGAKKVFNIGAGFYHHPKSTYTYDPALGNNALKQHSSTVFGADLFYDAPVTKKGHVLSVYSLYENMNFGDNYLRNIGILNTNTTMGTAAQLGNEYANRSVMGAGNLQPTIGTGRILYLQAGLKLPNSKNGSAFMPYLTLTNKKFEAIGKASTQYDVGVNYFLMGHNAKVTLQYGKRPVYKFDSSQPNGINQNGLKGQLTLQTEIFL